MLPSPATGCMFMHARAASRSPPRSFPTSDCGARRKNRTRRRGATMDAQGEMAEQVVAIRDGEDSTMWDRIVPFVYSELRAIAHRQLRREAEGHTLTTTELVHEAYLRLVDWEAEPSLEDRKSVV